ncbi:T9SS type A sorting domain-containing protein [Flavobacterium zepuense]|uniref:T9SS type A sorting domain-containing protein n=1 Tax=Flavobacterium zepuense TaxID=2593302 RepID=A0A552UX02_9FLAO|nr:zinc-dependent metalloprotease [Flavobacterium zepuense]TRW22739.1 T9SS type A sorting domain-containing protein [Flavobacterium zepuense]
MKQFLLSLSFLGSLMVAQAQETHQCGADGLHNHKMATDAGYAKRMHDFDARYSNGSVKKGPQTVGNYVIPVVVHVMHKGEALGTGTNITDEQIKAQIKALNEDYRKLSGEAGSGIGIDTGIEFALAVRDPQGNCTNGITRTDMTGVALYMNSGVAYDTQNGLSDTALKALDYWNSNQYYNIWIVSEFDNDESPWSGYAYFSAAHGQAYDGAVILAEYFGTGNSTTTHELGHALNLYHTFEGDSAGTACPPAANGCGSGQGDCITDIAAHKRTDNCLTTTNGCFPTDTNLDYRYNYMNYTSCKNMFTQGQKDRMIDALTTIRASLLAANGNMSLVPPALSSVAFDISGNVVCAGSTIKLTDASTCVPKTYLDESDWDGLTFNWTLTNGTDTYNYNTQNVNFTPTETGTYDVTLNITQGNFNVSNTATGAIVVTDPSEIAESCTPSPGQVGNFGYTIYNVGFNTINNSTSTYTGGYNDYKCTTSTIVYPGNSYPLSIAINSMNQYIEHYRVYIDYNGNGLFESDEMVADGMIVDLTNDVFTTSVTIPQDAVQGQLLTMRVVGNAGVVTDAHVSCTNSFFVGDIEDYGVYITAPLSTPDFAAKTITMVPNPANSTVTLSAQSDIEYVVFYNMLGQVVLQKDLNAAQSVLDVANLSAGTYIVHATSQGKTATLKLVKQ